MSENVLVTNDSTFQEDVLSNPGVVLVDFWAPWCGPCRALAPVIEEVANTFAGTAKVFKMNIDENAITPGKYSIRSIPTLLLFKNGALINTSSGFSEQITIEQNINNALA